MLASTVNLPAVAELYNQYPQSTVLNLADYSVIAYAIPPQTTQWACKRLARSSRIIPAGHPFIHKIKDAFR